MSRRLPLYAIVAAMLALLFGVGMTSAAFACEPVRVTSLHCADSTCDAQSVDRGCALACAPIAPTILPAIGPTLSLVHQSLTPSAVVQSGLVSRPTGPEPPPPRSA